MTSISHHYKIRKMLHSFPDGLTTKELAEKTKIDKDVLNNALKAMPDTYVDRWVVIKGSPLSSVWCAVVPPEDCPKPTKETK
jgi:hypothetical protein